MMSHRKRLLILALILISITGFFETAPASAQANHRTDRGIDQVWVPAGCFMMGAGDYWQGENYLNAHPQHEVCLTDGFWLDEFDVTNAAYQQFSDAGGYANAAYWTPASWQWLQTNKITGPRDYPGFGDAQQPRIGVSFYEAMAYARWRGGTLPTEAQWEYAARGPKDTIYPWGDSYILGFANVDERELAGIYRGHTTPVGSYAKDVTWIGAYDMAGNAWQWTTDVYAPDAYAQSGRDNPQGPATGSTHVVRGGAWGFDQDCAMTMYRFRLRPETRSASLGFRIITPQSGQPTS